MAAKAGVDRRIDSFIRNGWYPVPYRHHPKPIKEALREIGMRPQMKQCFANCQRFITQVDWLELEYHEGYATSLIAFPHGWLVWEGQRIDLTLDIDDCVYHESIAYTQEEVLINVVQTGLYTVIDPRALELLHPWRADWDAAMSE